METRCQSLFFIAHRERALYTQQPTTNNQPTNRPAQPTYLSCWPRLWRSDQCTVSQRRAHTEPHNPAVWETNTTVYTIKRSVRDKLIIQRSREKKSTNVALTLLTKKHSLTQPKKKKNVSKDNKQSKTKTSQRQSVNKTLEFINTTQNVLLVSTCKFKRNKKKKS